MKNKFILLTMLMSMAMLSCQKDTKKTENKEPGDTYMLISVRVSNSKSVSKTTHAGTALENKIVDAMLYVVDVDETTGNTLEFSKIITLDAGGKSKEKVFAKSGTKNIYIVANPSLEIKNIKLGITEEAFKTTLVSAKQADIASDDKFIMIGVTPNITINDTPDDGGVIAPTPVAVTVSRVAAKVVVGLKETVIQASPGSFAGSFSAPKFVLANTTKQRYLTNVAVGGFSPLNIVNNDDPNNVSYSNINDFPNYAVAENMKSILVTPTASEHTWDYTRAFSDYCGENINEYSTKKNTTHVLIEMVYTPATSEYSDGALDSGGTFYSVKTTTGRVIYTTEVGAQADVNSGGAPEYVNVETHIGGKCYYRLDIKDDKKIYKILPNNLYRVDINAINSVGSSKPDQSGPNDTIEEGGMIVATITVAPWTATNISEPIG